MPLNVEAGNFAGYLFECLREVLASFISPQASQPKRRRYPATRPMHPHHLIVPPPHRFPHTLISWDGVLDIIPMHKHQYSLACQAVGDLGGRYSLAPFLPNRLAKQPSPTPALLPNRQLDHCLNSPLLLRAFTIRPVHFVTVPATAV
jgi:hypothetical protein